MDGIQDTGLASISFRDFKPDVQINSDSGLYLPAKPALILANDEEPLLSWHPLDKFGAVSPTEYQGLFPILQSLRIVA